MNIEARKEELSKIMNTVPFNTPEWNNASDEFHDIRIKEIAENPVKDWKCDTDGEWWI